MSIVSATRKTERGEKRQKEEGRETLFSLNKFGSSELISLSSMGVMSSPPKGPWCPAYFISHSLSTHLKLQRCHLFNEKERKV